MTWTRRMGLALLLVLSTAAEGEAAKTCSAEQTLKDHLSRHHVEESYVLAYDHGRGDRWWRGYWWSCTEEDGKEVCTLTELEDAGDLRFGRGRWKPQKGVPAYTLFEVRPEGHPRLTVPRGREVRAFVVGTNPLVYSVTAGDGKEADHEDLAELQKLALAIGGAATGFAQISAVTVDALPAVTAKKVTPKSIETLNDYGINAAQAAEATQPAWITSLSPALSKGTQQIRDALETLNGAAIKIRTSLAELEDGERFLRAVETTTLTKERPKPPSEAALHEQFEALSAAREELVMVTPLCPDELLTLRRLLDLALLERPPTTGEIADHTALITSSRRSGGCDVDGLWTTITAAFDWLAVHPPGTKIEAKLRELLKTTAQGITSYRTGTAKRAEALPPSQALLDKRQVPGSRASLLAHVLARPPGVDADACHLTHGVLPVARSQGAGASVPWSKVRTETFTVAFDDSLKTFVTPTRAKRDEKYEVQAASRWRGFDIDLGLVHSQVEQVTYSAVAATTVDGAGGSAGEGGEAEPTLVIAPSERERRSGEVAMFVSYLPDRLQRGGLSFGPQLGVGLDDDHPALYAGAALSLGRYLNLSGGWSWQEVEDLVRGQAPGTVVTSKDDIRTRKGFVDDWYVSLAITLDDLPFFGGGD